MIYNISIQDSISTFKKNKVAKKNTPDKNGYVFSTDPEFVFQNESNASETLTPAKQRLRIILDTRYRGGKTITSIIGFVGKSEDLEILGKKLKQYCGTGVSVKDGQILIQGDQTLKVRTYLQKEGYKL
jgi:translation initiation factor 1